MEEKRKFIDIKKVFTEKSKKWSRIVPGFLIEYLRKIAHEDDLNDFLNKHNSKRGTDFLRAYSEDFRMDIATVGTEQVPEDQQYIFAANHPIGSHDGVLLIKAVSELFGPCKAVINDLLLNVEPLREFFIGVNKHGAHSKESVAAMDEVFATGQHLITYPSGLVSRRRNGVVKDLEWKKTVVTRAKRHKVAVVPVHITGQNSNFFYNFARLREMSGIKFPLEMLYLVDELYNKMGDTLTFTFGKPIEHTVFDKSHTPDQWAAKLREHVYKLPETPTLDFL